MPDAGPSEREPGLLWESWILTRDLDGERVMTDQVIVERLEGDRWCVQRILWPRRLHQRRFVMFDSTEEASRTLIDLHAQGRAVGTWHESRFGHECILAMVADSKPHW